jgi:hypothetical protein
MNAQFVLHSVTAQGNESGRVVLESATAWHTTERNQHSVTAVTMTTAHGGNSN